MHVLWLSFPAFSHIKGTLGVVEELLRRGHRVTYVVAERLADAVAESGARVVPYHTVFPASLDLEESATAMLVEFVRESFAPLETALQAAEQDPPDLIVHDALASDTAAVLSRRHGVPTVRNYAGYGTNEHVPQNGTEPDPDHEPADPGDPRMTALVAELTARVAAAGVEDLVGGGLSDGDDALLNVSYVAREFQPGGETFGDDYLFAGPCLRPSDFAGDWTPPADGSPVLLISLGTTGNQRPDFFRACARAFASSPWHVVMTLGKGVDPAGLGELPPNVEARAWVPHLAVLEHASVFVCQGGSGSLMEAFHQGVPAVVIPKQHGTEAIARQVEDLGVGRILHDADLNEDTLRAAVDEVAHSEEIGKRVRALRDRVRRAPGAPGAADGLEAVAGLRARSRTVPA
jgi:MGT family glycosyltransferase